MKILQIVRWGSSNNKNGLTEAVYNLSKSIEKYGIDIKIVIPDDHFLIDNKLVFKISSLRDLKTMFENWVPDLVIFNSFYEIGHIPIALFLKRHKIPYVIAFHGGASIDNFKKNHIKKLLGNFLIFNRFVRCASGVIYLNEGEKKKSIFHKQNNVSYIIPNGINPPHNISIGPNKDKITILFLSRMDFYGKGLDVLLKVVENLQVLGYDKRVQFKFYGYTNDNIETYFSKFGEFARYSNAVYGSEKDRVLRESNIMILPSRSEGMPMTILEGLAYGMPAIVTPETNMGEVLINGSAGWVSELNEQSLLETIKSAIDDYECNYIELRNNALKLAAQYTWDTIAMEAISLFRRIIKHGRV